MSDLSTFFDDIIEEEITQKPPISELKELAKELEKKTKGLLIGRIEQKLSSLVQFELNFYIVAPSLNNYSCLIFTINHSSDYYPLKIKTPFDKQPIIQRNVFPDIGITIENEENLIEKFKEIFSSPEIKKVINGLLAQIKAT